MKDFIESINWNKQTSVTAKKTSIKISYLEIYNEKVRDLLSEKIDQNNLMILEDVNKNIIVSDLTEKFV